METPIIDRFWAMPSKNTFSIPPFHALIEQYRRDGISIDPFANAARLTAITNDLDPSYDTDYHRDATDFLSLFPDQTVDFVLYDPPFSSRQVSECYRRLGRTVNMETTQNSYCGGTRSRSAALSSRRALSFRSAGAAAVSV